MKKKEVMNTIRIGLIVPPSYLKRSSWAKVKRVMEYLVNKGLVNQREGEIKYARKSFSISVEQLADVYMASPFLAHFDSYKKLGEDLHLPLNSHKLLKAFNDLTI